ncbi:MAG: hypothetical protein J6Z50_01620 [Fibrobacterales bacterium]|nr:hypothetical protein [Fibrobacterales bacterium]
MRTFPAALALFLALAALGCGRKENAEPAEGRDDARERSAETRRCDGVRYDPAEKSCVQDRRQRNHLVWRCASGRIDRDARFCLDGQRMKPVCAGEPYDPAKKLCDPRGRELLARDSACGTLVDPRDGKSYRTVRIGRRLWMAENLDYNDTAISRGLVRNSWCFDDDEAACARRGRLYTWTAAMDLDPGWQNAPAAGEIDVPHRGICPEGWHVPTNREWDALLNEVAGSWPWDPPTALLRARSWNGVDLHGFAVAPTGFRTADGEYFDADSVAAFWTATESTLPSDAYYRRFAAESDEGEPVYRGFLKSYGRALRCAKDPS